MRVGALGRLGVALYLVVHELLVKVAKHLGAKEAHVRATAGGSDSSVVVEGTGSGFALSPASGLGLENTEEPLRYLGVRMLVRSERHRGMRVELHAPLLDHAPAEVEAVR